MPSAMVCLLKCNLIQVFVVKCDIVLINPIFQHRQQEQGRVPIIHAWLICEFVIAFNHLVYEMFKKPI